MSKKIKLFWEEFLKNLDVYIAIIAAIIFFVLGTIGKVSIPIVLSSTLAILAILAYSILKNRQINEATETTLASLAKILPDKNQMYETKERAYKFLEEYISTHYVNEAILIQHTAITCQQLLKTLVRNGASVSIYIQHEETAVKTGMQRAVNAIEYMSQFLQSNTGEFFNPGGKVKLYKYHVPASVHGIKLDEKVLSLGSYIYVTLDPSTPTDSARLLGGNDIPTAVVWHGTEEFELLNKLFIKIETSYQKNSEQVPLP